MDRRPIGPGGSRYPPPEQAYRGRGRGHPNGDRGPNGGYRNSNGDRGGSNFGRGGPPPASSSRSFGNGRGRGFHNNGYDQSYHAAAGQRRNDTREASARDDDRTRKVSPVAPNEQFRVLTNHFEITRIPSKVFIPYDVSFSPEVKELHKRHALFHNLRSEVAPNVFPKHGIYDGRAQFWTCTSVRLVNGTQQQWQLSLNRTSYLITITRIEGADINTEVVQRLTERGTSSTDGQTQSALRLLQLLVRQASMRFPSNRRAYFPRPLDRRSREIELQASIHGIALRVGYFQSVRPTVGRLLVNVDQALAAFYASGPLIDVSKKVLGQADVSGRASADRALLSRHFRKVKVNVPALARAKSTRQHIRQIHDIVPKAGYLTFDLNGKLTSVKDYFAQTHSITLIHPDYFGVVVSPRNSKMQVVIPAELCVVCEDQFYQRRLTEALTTKALELSKKKPYERQQYICGMDYRDKKMDLQTPLSSYKESPYILEAGMTISSQMAEVEGKQLAPPTLLFNGRQEAPRNGSWNFNSKQTHKPARIDHFIFINFARVERGFDQEDFPKVSSGIQRACSDIGMRIGEYTREYSGNMANVESILETAFADIPLDKIMDNVSPEDRKKAPAPKPEDHDVDVKGDPIFNFSRYRERCLTQHPAQIFALARHRTIFLVLLPENAQPQYDAIKHWGDIVRGVTTQCICMSGVRKWYPNRSMNDRFAKNVAIKINVRLGGINWQPNPIALTSFDSGFPLIIGADVGHPGPNQLRPSIASVVFSRDKDAMQYDALTFAQPPRLEMVEQLRGKVLTALRQFLAHNNPNVASKGVQIVPTSVVFYRDGLSEGQFEVFARQEIAEVEQGISDAWSMPLPQDQQSKELQLPPSTLTSLCVPRPPLTYIVVTKRHHVRFFATEDGQKVDLRNGNLRAGFATTSGIDNPYYHDFYLQSHHALQGTARPAHYTVLQDRILDNSAQREAHADRLDLIRGMSFYLCHAYSRATTSVSIPAPVYYADARILHLSWQAHANDVQQIACRRGNIHLDVSLRYGGDPFSDDSSDISEAAIELKIQNWCQSFRRIFNGHSPMYFI